MAKVRSGDGGAFSIELDQADIENPEVMGAFQETMNSVQDAMVEEQEQIAEELGVTEDYAGAIQYLRTRSRWTQELEDRLIRLSSFRYPVPNMNEWP